MKTEFTTSNGHEGMTIDCGKYVVEIFKSALPNQYGQTIKYTEKKTGTTKVISAAFKIDWESEDVIDANHHWVKLKSRKQ